MGVMFGDTPMDEYGPAPFVPLLTEPPLESELAPGMLICALCHRMDYPDEFAVNFGNDSKGNPHRLGICYAHVPKPSPMTVDDDAMWEGIHV